MSVKKGERKPSRLEAYHLVHQIKNELVSYVLKDFGMDLLVLKGLPKNYSNFIVMKKSDLLQTVNKLDATIYAAESCRIVVDSDLKWRRNKLLKAIELCYDIERSCMTVIEVFKQENVDININKYYRLIQLVSKEIDLIRSLKNKDLQLFRKLKKDNEKQGIYMPVG